MKEIYEFIFREGLSHKIGLTESELILNVIGTGSMALGFITFGIFMLMGITVSYPPTKAKLLALKLFSWALIFAGLVFAANMLAHWHNFPVIRGMLKCLVGIHLIGTAFITPQIVRENNTFKKLMEIEENLDTTKRILNEVKEINRKL